MTTSTSRGSSAPATGPRGPGAPGSTYRLATPARSGPTTAGRARRAPAGASSTTPAGRCSCWPAPAPARRPPWSRRSSTGSRTAAPHPSRCCADLLPQGRRAAARPGHRPRSAAPSSTPLCSTFHSFAYGLIRRYAPAELYAGPLRLLSAPEQDVVLRELLHRRPRVGAAGPSAPAARSAPAASPARSRGALPRPGEGPRPRRAAPRSAARTTAAGVRGGRAFLEQYLDVLDEPERDRLRRPDPPRGHRGRRPPRRAPRPVHATSSSTSTRTPTPRRSRCSARWPATAAT